MSKLLVVDDDVTFSQMLESFLKKQGHEPDVYHCVKDGMLALQNHSFDLCLFDYRLPDGNGLELLRALRAKEVSAPAVIMTSFNDVRTAVNAMRLGAFDYITKPVNRDELLMVINQALEKKNGKKVIKKTAQPEFIEGKSAASKYLLEHTRIVAPTDMSVIIQGESGTGKEYIARLIHRLSKRSDAPFVAIDCGALSGELASSELFGHVKGAFTGALFNKKGQFEDANGGTLFLDEVGNLSYEIQVKLLRTLQERVIQSVGSNQNVKVDVRILTATNDDLTAAVKIGKFREDLYHRLNEFTIKVPPLRERAADLPVFVEHFVNTSNLELNRNVQRISPEVMELFHRYDWPGNLRELKNVVKRAVLLTQGDEAQQASLPEEMAMTLYQQPLPENTGNLQSMLENNERDLILKTMHQVKYNKAKAARLLNIDRKTLYNKILKYNLEF